MIKSCNVALTDANYSINGDIVTIDISTFSSSLPSGQLIISILDLVSASNPNAFGFMNYRTVQFINGPNEEIIF